MASDIIITSFNAGELSPLLDGRSDLEKYYFGARIYENFIPLPYGPAERRPGTYFVTELKDNSKKARLIPFQYSTEQAYVLEFGDQYIRFLKDRGQIIHGVGTEDLSGVDDGALIAHWLLNEEEAVTVVNDDNPGTYDGVATADASMLHTTGKVGTGCFDLDGQYTVEIADDAAFSFDDSGANPFSIVCWGYVTQQADVQVLLSKWRDQNTAREWRFSLNNDRKLQLHLADSSADLSSLRIAHWLLNEDAADKNVLDEDATSHDGLTQTDNTADLTATGKVGKCLDLNGADAVVITNDNDELSFGDSATDDPFSIAAWVYVTNENGTRYILSKRDITTGSEAREWSLGIETNEKIIFSLVDESANATQQKKTSSGLSTGWHFVVATYDGSGGDDATDGMTLYIDNVAVAQSAVDSGTYVAMENTATKVIIGGSYTVGGVVGFFWDDKIDNVALFNAELTAVQVALLWNDGNGTESLAGATSTPFAVSDDVISTGWHFFGCTYDSTGGATAADGIILYVDGAAVDSTATNDADYTAMQAAGEAVRIGSQNNIDDDADEGFWGDKIDEVSIFSDVLTPTEVASLYSTEPYEISSDYLEADLFGLQHAQSADVLYNVHGSYPQTKLIRFEHDLWELDNIVYDQPPFLDENITDTTITPSAKVGTIELTASTPVFTLDHVGSYWLIKHPRSDNNVEKSLTTDYSAFAATGETGILVDVKGSWRVKTSAVWTGTLELERTYDELLVLVLDAAPAGGAWAAGDIITGATSGDTCIIVAVTDTTHYFIKQLSGSFTDGEILSNQSGNSRDVAAAYPRYEGWSTLETLQSTQDQNFNVTGEETLGNAYLRVKRTVDSAGNDPTVVVSVERFYHYGIVKITGFTSATSVSATVIKTLGSTDATKLWSEGAWSDQRGYPVTTAFYEGRLWNAGTSYRPLDIWGSRTNDYENMEIGTLDDDSVKFTVDSSMQNMIRWLVGQEVLLIGTSGGEWRLGSSDPADAITPTNPMRPRIQTTYGSEEIQALLLANAVLFVDAQGRRVRGAQYIFEKGETGGYDAPDYTEMSEHITESGIVDMAFQQNPYPILWCVRNDGVLIGMVFEPGQKVWGWFRCVIDGLVESVAVIRGVTEDEVWIIVKRTIDGNTKRYIEYFKPRDWGDDQADCFFVDSGLSFDGGAAIVITGITQADPGVVTAAAHGFSDGDQVKIVGVAGMVEINQKIFTVASAATDTFELRDELDSVDFNTTTYTTFASSITGDVEEGSYTISNVSAADIAKLAFGTTVTGTGILSDTTITVIGDDSFTMSNKAIETNEPVTITARGTVMQVDNTFAGLDHLEGKTVSVLGDGSVHEDVIVSSGTVALTDYFNKVHIGLPFKSALKPMKLAFPGANIRGKKKRIHQIIFSFFETLGAKFGPTSGDETIPFRKTTDPLGAPPPLFTGEKVQTFNGGYELNADIYAEQTQPLPMTVRSITARLGIYD